jgi:hypothetical protein
MRLSRVSPSDAETTTRRATMFRTCLVPFFLIVLVMLQIACTAAAGSGGGSPQPVPPVPNVSIGITPTTAMVAPGAAEQFQAGVKGSANTAVQWSTNAGTVSAAGLFTAPIVGATSAAVSATSVADPTKQATAAVSIVGPPAPPLPPPNSLAGGLTALPPAQPLGSNQVANSSFESGSTGWSLPSCFSIDSGHAHSGTHSLLYTAAQGCGSLADASQNITRDPGAARSYALLGWVMTSPGSNLSIKLAIHDATDGGLVVGEAALSGTATSWTLIQQNDIDLLPVHDGDTLTVEVVVTGTTGQAWFDDIQLIEQKPLPMSTFLLYPNYKGYLWGNGPQTVRLRVDVPNPANMQIVGMLQVDGGSIVKSVQQAAQTTQELDFDGSSLLTGSYLVSASLLDASGSTVATYPSYRVKKVDPSFQNTLVNYIDADNFLVRNGHKHFVWGSYDRWSAHRCGSSGGLPCVSTNEAAYLQVPGFNGLSTINSYAQTMLNTEMNILPFAGVDVNSSRNQLTPWLADVNKVGVGHLQIVNNWCGPKPNNPYGCQVIDDQPVWSFGLTNQQMWSALTTTQKGNPGALGYYNYDEPTVDALPAVFSQWPALSSADPGGVIFGTSARVAQFWRWHDMADVMSCDPYPIGSVLNVDDYAYGARTAPPMVRTSIWTREVVQQSYASRPVWMVLQLFDFQNQFPAYSQMKMQAYKAIINGATGILWWGYVSQQGLEYEWYVAGDQQPYFDFERISQEVMALEPFLISAAQPSLLSSLSNPSIEYLVKVDSNNIVIFASNFSDTNIGNVTFTLSSSVKLSSTSVQVYSENRNVPLSGSNFTDSFAANDVHVYEVSFH